MLVVLWSTALFRSAAGASCHRVVAGGRNSCHNLPCIQRVGIPVPTAADDVLRVGFVSTALIFIRCAIREIGKVYEMRKLLRGLGEAA